MRGRESNNNVGLKSNLALAESFSFAIDNMKVRFARSIISVLSISLSVGFMGYLLTLSGVLASLRGAMQVEPYLYWFAFTAFFVVVVGVVNVMLMSVFERYKEIGTMKCLGARDGHILALFLWEGIISGLIGGLIGGAVGISSAIISVGAQAGFDKLSLVPIIEYLRTFLLSFLLSLLLSVVGAVYPAFRASRLNIVEALRHEL